ncbi:class II aldolase/adducin family protein [Candidatus Saganbacteria bacterium]|nr:class II aldolase/adducin family protein [Candidatus Saganbacteria bacterium]
MLEQFQFVGRKLFEEGLVGSHNGSLSVREGDKIAITVKNAMLSEIKKEDIIEVPLEGEIPANAPFDLPVHRSIYANTKTQAIVHAKSPYGISISIHEEKIIPQDHEGKQFLKSIPVIRVREPITTEEVIRFLTPTFKSGYNALLVRGFGSYAGNSTLENAYRLTSILENSCKVSLLSKAPSTPPPAPKREDKRAPYRSAIPPSIGVMDRSYNRDRGKR